MERKNSKRKICFLVAFMLIFSVAITGCVDTTEKTKDDSLEKVLNSGQLIVGIDGGFYSMAFYDENGILMGFDVDMAREVCSRLGVDYVPKKITWSEKEDILKNNGVDCIWSAMSITPSREESMALSEPYLNNSFIFLVPGKSEARSSRDLINKVVGVQKGTTGYDALYSSDIKDDVSVILDSYPNLLRKLQRGVLDAVLIDSTFAYHFIYTNEDKFYVLSDSLGDDEYAIGFRKSDLKLRDAIQEKIDEMMADGTLAEISEKWFGSNITIAK